MIRITGYSTIIKKYILSWLFLLIVIFIFYKATSINFFNSIAVIYCTFYGLLYLRLNITKYNEDEIIFNGIKYSTRQIIKVDYVNINKYYYLRIKIKDIRKNKTFLVDPGPAGFGLVEIIASFLFKNSGINKWDKFVDFLELKSKENTSA